MNTHEDIQIANIEKELACLHESQKAKERTPACLFNLIIYSQNQQRSDYLQRIRQAIITKFPCRIIFIQGNPDPSANYLKVNVSTETVGKIVCDMIYIEASTAYLNRVPFLIFPHLVPDLPLQLLWGQNPTTDQIILPHLIFHANRLIFDADNAENIGQFTHDILEMMQTHPKLSFLDVNWGLTSGWRKVLAQVFDTPEARQHLQFTNSLNIYYNDRKVNWLKHNDFQPRYLIDWLASQLNWSLENHVADDHLQTFTFHNGVKNFDIHLRPQLHVNLYPGTIVGIDVFAEDEHSYVIAPIPDLPKVVVHISTAETCELPYTLPLSGLTPGFHYVKELLFADTSEHYKKMLAVEGVV
ncbi:MAG: glucose-6-phosphate dehydrogenase assembly protein OpcA [Parachlamydiaceae bacterium]|nr:glucose-6-phosphate dehydrogenase assembly protein OpcA [Parachlamydiaceae bacterium]